MFSWRIRTDFVRENIEELPEMLQNPGRGWYQIHSFDICTEIDPEELKWCLEKQDSLALVMIDISDCRCRSLTDDELRKIRNLFDFFRQHDKDMILRIVYDREGKGLLKEPSNLALIQAHMRQIAPLIREYADSVFVLQGLFIGNWGEMHGSSFLSEQCLKKLWETLEEATEGKCPVAVRKPVQWRILHKNIEKGKKENMALFDDAMFASSTHLGTFGERRPEKKEWDLPWGIDDELEFEEKYLARVPNGGEALAGEELRPEEIVGRLRRMHICYLNRVYDERRLQEWKQSQWVQDGVYQGISVYEYIALHLGYRFVVRDVKVKIHGHLTGGREMDFKISVWIENVGFGNLCQEADCLFYLKSSAGREKKFPVGTDARKWDSGTVATITENITLQTSFFTEKNDFSAVSFYIMLERHFDRKRILFGNENREEGVCLGVLRVKGTKGEYYG